MVELAGVVVLDQGVVVDVVTGLTGVVEVVVLDQGVVVEVVTGLTGVVEVVVLDQGVVVEVVVLDQGVVVEVVMGLTVLHTPDSVIVEPGPVTVDTEVMVLAVQVD